MAASMQSSDKGKIIAWAKLAKKIYVPVNGTGGGIVAVNRKDFIELMRSIEYFDGHATFSETCNLYLGG